MKLYKIGGFLLALLCLGLLVFSYLSWQEKIDSAANAAPADAPKVADSTSSQKKDNLTAQQITPTADIEALAGNMDEEVRKRFLDQISEGTSIHLLIAGSDALEAGNPGYAERLESELLAAYGDLIEVSTETIDSTSEALASVDLSAQYDLVLLEPLTLMNNGLVTIEEEREDIREFSARLQGENPDALVILHPPQPIFGAGYYLAQVAALREFASLYGYAYINHWSAWPDTDDLELKELLSETAVPNDAGAEVWASELINYFIAN